MSSASMALTEVPHNRAAQASAAAFQHEVARAASAHSKTSGPIFVQPTRTSLSGSQASEAIKQAYSSITGEQPSEGTLAILTSHWALETGQGKSMYNYNFAGIKGRGPEGMTTVMKTREGYGESTVHIKDGFRAYQSAQEGAKDYISLLVRKYGSAIDAAKAEQPERFAHELKVGGYFTGDPVLYAKGVTRLANQAMQHGFDALGATAGPLSNQPKPVQPYFAPSPSPGPATPPYGMAHELAHNVNSHEYFNRHATVSPWRASGSGFEPGTAAVDALTDEMSRTALLIAAQRGAV